MEAPIKSHKLTDSYFVDGIRKVHFVIVVSRVSAHENGDILESYFTQLQRAGLMIEQSFGITVPVVFIKIHIPETTVARMELSYPAWKSSQLDKDKAYKKQTWWHMFETKLLLMDSLAGEDVLGKIYYISEILNHAAYGSREGEYGLPKLMSYKIIAHAFPLHDGRIQKDLWHFDDLMNTRTKLAKYWSGVSFFKIQPIDWLKRYYGLEVAIYFAFYSFYLQSMLPMAILSIFLWGFSLGRYFLYLQNILYVEQICEEGNRYICGTCIKKLGHCWEETFKENCNHLKFTLIIDNQITTAYAILMSVWSGFLAYMWTWKEKDIKERWNLTENEYHERFRFREVQKYRRKSILSGKIEAYTPTATRIVKSIAVFLISVMIATMIFFSIYLNVNFVTLARIYTTTHNFNQNYRDAGRIRSAFDTLIILIQVGITKLCFKLLNVICYWLVVFQKFKYDYDSYNCFLYLRCTFAFFNQNAIFLYMAFLKGIFYNIPYEKFRYNIFTAFQFEKCQPHTCMESLFTLLNVLSVSLLIQIGIEIFNIRRRKPKMKGVILPQFEYEYLLKPVPEYYFQIEYCRIMAVHGFLTFFAAGNVLGSLLTFLIAHLRCKLNSHKFVYQCRRPIPKIVHNTSSWGNILIFLALSGLVINALVIAITSESIEKTTYIGFSEDFTGYYASRLSLFAKKDLFGKKYGYTINDTCWYRGMQQHPQSPSKYERTIDYWRNIYKKIRFIVFFELAVVLCLLLLHFMATTIRSLTRKFKQIIEKLEVTSVPSMMNRLDGKKKTHFALE